LDARAIQVRLEKSQKRLRFARVKKYAKVVSLEKIGENDHNLSVTRYVDVFGEDAQVDVKQVWQELRTLESERLTVEEQLKTYLKELGYE